MELSQDIISVLAVGAVKVKPDFEKTALPFAEGETMTYTSYTDKSGYTEFYQTLNYGDSTQK